MFPKEVFSARYFSPRFWTKGTAFVTASLTQAQIASLNTEVALYNQWELRRAQFESIQSTPGYIYVGEIRIKISGGQYIDQYVTIKPQGSPWELPTESVLTTFLDAVTADHEAKRDIVKASILSTFDIELL